MLSKRVVFFFVALGLIAFWLLSRPDKVEFSVNSKGSVERQPSGQVEESVGESVEAQTEVVTIPNQHSDPNHPLFTKPEKTPDMHTMIAEMRKRMRGTKMDLRDSRYMKYRERIDVKAAPSRTFNDLSGGTVAKIGHYTVYPIANSVSTLNDFDGQQLPVVVDDKARMGVVNGDIRVAFKVYPADLSAFASRYDLKVIRAFDTIRTVFFSPKTYPAAIVDVVSKLSKDPAVKIADLDIIFRGPVPK